MRICFLSLRGFVDLHVTNTIDPREKNTKTVRLNFENSSSGKISISNCFQICLKEDRPLFNIKVHRLHTIIKNHYMKK